VRDLRGYAQHNDSDLFHYRDKAGLEADMIVQSRDGRWGAISKPSFLLILTGGQYAFRRKDGVIVVPVGCLKD
jgi:hypothetical protein